MQLKVCIKKNNIISVIGIKEFNPITYQASKWVREEINNLKTFDVPQTTNGINIVTESKSMIGSLTQNAIGFFHNNANSPYYNAQFVGIYSTAFNCGHGLSITPNNFMKICALFTARKTIKSNWINQKDEYSSPNMNLPDYKQWNNDAIVYSLFNNSSNQSSLRNINYKGKIYQIKNEFFFVSIDEMKNVADKHDFRDMLVDIRENGEDRFVYKLLQNIKLSYDARDVLKTAQDLICNTMIERISLHRGHPEYNLQAWDAGYLQLKQVWKDKALPNGRVDGFEEFREKYKMLEDRLRDGVYEFGFLNH